MPSVSRTRIVGNKYNAILAATILASEQRASNQIYTLAQQRSGNGRMVLAGPYTGAADSVVDVEVLGGSAGELRASAPIVNGIGNGTLDVQSIDVGAAAQTLQFTLLDAGTSPVSALLDFFGVQLAARAIGVLGNNVTLAVVRSLTFTDLPFATLEKMTAGSAMFDGPQYDWGQPAATGSDIPEGALRMAFSGFPTVHRAWKTWDSGRFVYRLDPPLPFDIPENARVREVTGDYELTVADGVATDEVYTAVTMHDFLSQVQARSALIQVLGVVAPDRAPGGQAVTDIPLRTDAHALPVIASATRNGATMLVGDVDPAAATQNVTVTCLGRAAGGAQTWSVSGGVVGPLPAAFTGQLYESGPVQFTIQQPPIATALDAGITGRFLPTSRESGEGLPAICFKPLLLGVAATNKEVTFEYRARPPDECSCSTATPLKVSMQCLGLSAEGGGVMDAEYQSRLIDLYEWNASFVSSNIKLLGLDQTDVDLATSCTSILADALAEVYNVPTAATAWDGILVELIAEMAPFMDTPTGSGTATTGPGAGAWTPRAFSLGASYLNPANGHRYTIDSIEVNGTAVNSTPADATLPIASDSAVWLTDGTSFTVTEVTDVVLTVTDMGLVTAWGRFAVGRTFYEVNPASNISSATSQVRVTEILVDGLSAALPTDPITWDTDRFNAVGTIRGVTSPGANIVLVSSVRLAPLGAGENVAVGYELINSLNHRGYRIDVIEVATVSVNAASARLPVESSAVWLDDLSTFDVTMTAASRTSLVLGVTDAELTLAGTATGISLDAPPEFTPVAGYITPPFIPSGADEYFIYSTNEGFARTTYLNTAAVAQQTEAQAYRKARFARMVEYFPAKYAAKMDWVRTIAGIPPKANASSAGSPCWRDFGNSYWWEDVEGFYLPAFTNHPFVSAKRNADNSISSTQEFGFGLVTACDHRLKEGDRITIRINGTNSAGSWAEGDRFVIPLIGAASAPLTGGSDGDPTQTWTVRSSVLGSLADYAFLASAPTPWAHAPATVELVPGGIAFEIGDSLSFDIEGGQLRWRRDGGSWTTEDLYAAAPLDLGDGLLLDAQPGTAPSFMADDTWQFSAIATYGTQRMRQPRIGQAFAWDGSSVVLEFDLLTAQPIEAVMLAMHDLPLTASVVVDGGVAGTTDWTVNAEVRKGIIMAALPYTIGAPLAEARYLKVTITGAGSGGSIGWSWAGVGWQPTVGPSSMKLKRQYGLAKGSGINPGALYRGAGTGGNWTWALDSGAALLATCARDLMELVDHSAEQGMEPVALFPDIMDAVDASVALIDADEIELEEFSNWQDSATNVVSLSLPLRAVLA